MSYNPTIFPEIYGRKKINPSKAERLIARNKKKEESILVINKADENVDDEFVDGKSYFECVTHSNKISILDYNLKFFFSEPLICFNERTKEIGIQTDPVFDQNETENLTILFCSSDSNNVYTQTTIRIITQASTASKEVVRRSVSVDEIQRICKRTVSKSSGPDAEMHTFFTGFESLHSNESMKTFCGISLSFYDILLEFIVAGKDGQPRFFKKVSRHNRLLLFLMKLKLGLSFKALGEIFQVSKATVSNIFLVYSKLC